MAWSRSASWPEDSDGLPTRNGPGGPADRAAGHCPRRRRTRQAAGMVSAYRRVLLATDLSEACEAATDAAIRLSRDHGAVLLVCSVVDPDRLRLPGGRFLRRLDQERAAVIEGAQQVVDRARSSGAVATFLVWDGDPAETVIAAADSEAVDATVIGSHGRGRLGRLLLGSTSKRVSEEARCQVIVVPS